MTSGGRKKTPRPNGGEEGFAAVDAIVALLILSSTLVLCINGLGTADRLARVGEETGRAAAIARQLLSAPSIAAEETVGQSGTLRWSVIDKRGYGLGGIAACVRIVDLRSTRDDRLYQFTTARSCG